MCGGCRLGVWVAKGERDDSFRRRRDEGEPGTPRLYPRLYPRSARNESEGKEEVGTPRATRRTGASRADTPTTVASDGVADAELQLPSTTGSGAKRTCESCWREEAVAGELGAFFVSRRLRSRS